MIVERDTYFIAHNGVDIFHHGWVEKGLALDSGQPIIETFSSKSQFIAKCKEYNIDLEGLDIPDFPVDTTPPPLSNNLVTIPEKYEWVFRNDRFELNGFVVEFIRTPDNVLMVDVAYLRWQAFRDELDKPENATVKQSLEPVWDYVLQIAIDNGYI